MHTYIKLNIQKAFNFVAKDRVYGYEEKANACNRKLHDGTGKGNDFLGWVNLPSSISEELISEIETISDDLRNKCEVVIVAGIGGSYLGAKAVIDALSNSFESLQKERKNPIIVYAGHNISEDYSAELRDFLTDKQFGIINISKSGTTTETALAFRLLKTQLENQVGKEEARKRIVAVTDASKGALRKLAEKEGYQTFVIPDNVGGRFSVLTPVGLLPVAVAGINIRELLKGATDMETLCAPNTPFADNPAAVYAAVRNELYKNGKKIEILVNYHPKLHYLSEWWKQLYGESEGKENKGIFPASVDFTTDLHSMGQWIQEGERTVFETVISVKKAEKHVEIPFDPDDSDGLNFLSGKRVDYVNKMAELGTQIAHIDGGVPNLHIELPALNAYYIGQLLYFFEKGCGISGYLLSVNPFDQPGVEAYKKNMFALLDKPGYEVESEEIKARL